MKKEKKKKRLEERILIGIEQHLRVSYQYVSKFNKNIIFKVKR
jgi:hypothetical protein